MRAVRFDHYGAVDVLHLVKVADPVPGPGEVLVRQVASSINPGEISIREGLLDSSWPATFPSGQGSDLAGQIAAVGDGVTSWHVGDDVLGWTDNRDAQAELVVVSQDQLSTRPPDVPWDQAACLHVAGVTAYAAVRAVDPQAGETVAVAGAAGGVGGAVVQLLRRLDVRIIGIAGEGNAEWLREQGADPVTYGTGLGHRLREIAPEGIDAFVDTFGGGYVELAQGHGVPVGRIVTIIDFDAAEKFGAKTVISGDETSAGVMTELADFVAAGELTFTIAATFPLDAVQEAYEQLAGRHTRGKIVLEIADPS